MLRGRERPRRWAHGRVVVSSAALVVALGATRSARAQPPSDRLAPELGLTWVAPPSCPPAAEIEAQFARLLGGAARPATSRRITAVATVQQAGGRSWAVRIETTIDGDAGVRALEGDSCWAVASATALLLALTIDPGAAGRATLAGSQAPPSLPREDAVVPSRPLDAVVAPSPVPPKAAPSVRPFVRAFGGAVFNLLPEVAPVGGLAVGLRRDWFNLELSGLVSAEVRAQALDLPRAGGDFRLLAVAVRGCGRVGAGLLAGGLCAGVELERILAVGFGVDRPGSGAATAAAAVATGVLSLRISARFAVSLDVSLAVRPYHPAFVLDGVGPVYTTPAVGGLAAIGPVMTL